MGWLRVPARVRFAGSPLYNSIISQCPVTWREGNSVSYLFGGSGEISTFKGWKMSSPESHDSHPKPEVVVAKVEARNMGKENLENFIAEVGVMIE